MIATQGAVLATGEKQIVLVVECDESHLKKPLCTGMCHGIGCQFALASASGKCCGALKDDFFEGCMAFELQGQDGTIFACQTSLQANVMQ